MWAAALQLPGRDRKGPPPVPRTECWPPSPPATTGKGAGKGRRALDAAPPAGHAGTAAGTLSGGAPVPAPNAKPNALELKLQGLWKPTGEKLRGGLDIFLASCGES